VDSSRDQLKKKIDELAGQIEETKRRLPAHSSKPPLMMELFDLEDRYNELCRRLEKLDKDESGSNS
jgi:ubiquinone biosynthesis protein UbiJ